MRPRASCDSPGGRRPRPQRARSSRAVFRELLETLAGHYEHALPCTELAPTHGRFSADHVFVASGVVTAVDLDRVARADPAKDVGELLHRMRWGVGKRGRVPAYVGEACDAFVLEYRASSPFGLSALAYHWSFSVVWTLLVLASGTRPRKGWDERSAFLVSELAAIPRRCAALLDT